MLFFFSSRRRHTRWPRDWSSDVCSSDLAGRGFAVVASEVKALATQTGKATEEIAAQIAAIQGATREAVQAIQAIGTTIGDISRISISIAAAMDQQGARSAERRV